MQRIICGLIIIVAVILPSRALAEDFTISYWNGPPAKFLSQERVSEIKEANFTIAFPLSAGNSPEQNKKFLDYCAKAGLKAVIADSRMIYAISGNPKAKEQLDAIVKDYSNHPALFGYYIVDEPGAGAFKGLGEVVAYLKEKDPRHPGYINLLPTYGRDFNVLGTKTYEEYVRKFVDEVKPFAISYDHYHFTNHGDRADFFENLDTVRKVALETNTPFWNIVLVVQHGDYRNLTEPELRYEAMQTIAFGGKGLLWFTYWSPQGIDTGAKWQHAMINEDGSRDPHYDMIKQINADVLAFGEALKGAKSTEIRAPQKQGPPFTLGSFKSDTHDLRFIASGDYKNAITLPLAVPSQRVERFDPATRKWDAVEIQPKNGKTYVTVDIPPGAAVLFRW